MGTYRSYGRGAYINPKYRPYADDELGYGYGTAEPTYQTMCVRMCDGYYWPVGAATPRWRMHDDAQQCTASCDAEVRLFYRPVYSSGAGMMIDLEGRSYAQLPNAFRYRKARLDGCQCRPAPWTASEVNRHRRYAAEDAAEVVAGRGAGDWRQSDVNAEAVAGVYSRPERKVPVPDEDVQEDVPEVETEMPQVSWGAYQNPPTYWNARPRVRYIPAPRYAWPGSVRRR